MLRLTRNMGKHLNDVVAVCTYVLMKIFEYFPGRYEAGIRLITLGKIDRVYENLVSHIKSGQRVLDVGCGTGGMTIKAAQVGAKVKGIDINPEMLEVAKRKAREKHVENNVELYEVSIAELERESSESYDVVTAVLTLSELSNGELNYLPKEVMRILKLGGLFLIADEVVPKNILNKIVSWLIRIPLAAITYLITQRITHAIRDLPERIEKAGFIIKSARLNKLENFIEIVAMKPLRGG